MLRIFRTRARQLFRSTAGRRENNRYRETANGSNTVTHIPRPACSLFANRDPRPAVFEPNDNAPGSLIIPSRNGSEKISITREKTTARRATVRLETKYLHLPDPR